MSQPYAGKYLRIDLTEGTVQVEVIAEEDARTYFLGSGYAAKLYAEEMNSEIAPLDPRNAIYIFNGLFTGTFAPTGCRSSWCGRSPLTGIWNEANVGGHIGAELRKAGVDGLVITGQAERPVYIYVHDDEDGAPVAEIRDAEGIWGLDTFEAYDKLLAATDPKARAGVIGPAGENLVRFAAVMQGGREHSRAAGRGGMGALLGSKRVKAIVAHGSQRPAYAETKAFRDIVKDLNSAIKEKSAGAHAYGTAGGMTGAEYAGDLPIRNWQGGSWVSGAHAISGQEIHEKYWIKHTFCHACPIGCGKLIEITEGPYKGVYGEGPEYETLAGFGSLLDIDDLAAVARSNDLCNKLGLDTISASSTLAFATEAFQKGLISAEDLDGVTLDWGHAEGVHAMLHKIAYREALGDLLAEGARRAAQALDENARHYAIEVKGLEMAYHDPRAFFSMAASYATANRGACHLEGLTYWAMYGLDASAWYDVPYERFDDEGAGKHAKAFQDYQSLYNPLGLCKFAGKVGYLYERMPDLINAAAGWDMTLEEVRQVGERLFNLKRIINNRLGITRADDTLPERLLTEPRPSGQAEGKLPDLDLQLREYYAARGWLEDGRPGPEKLAELGLEAFAAQKV